MFNGRIVALIIPALDEEEAIGDLLKRVDRRVVDRLVVADNGSRDRTAEVAEGAGAEVVSEERRGYGSACLTGIATVSEADLLVFMDGDGSDDPVEIEAMLRYLEENSADLVIGSRILGRCEKGAMTPAQRFGSFLTGHLLRLFWKVECTDLGPFRALTRPALERLAMSDPDFGWTIEMQVKAAQLGLTTVEFPVTRQVRKAGVSKVSGTIVGSWRAGKRILGYVFAAKLRELLGRAP